MDYFLSLTFRLQTSLMFGQLATDSSGLFMTQISWDILFVLGQSFVQLGTMRLTEDGQYTSNSLANMATNHYIIEIRYSMRTGTFGQPY